MSRAVRLAVAVVLVMLLVTAGTVTAVWESQRQVTVSERAWCAVMELLTAARISPSQGAEYRLYLDFLALESQYGCS